MPNRCTVALLLSSTLSASACASGTEDMANTFSTGVMDGLDEASESGSTNETGTGTDETSGETGAPCEGDTVDCNGTCVDTTSDPAHCGGCGLACDDGQACSEGSCTVCEVPTMPCEGACVDTTHDPAHCGGCGNACGPAQLCALGQCVDECPPPTMSCEGVCIDVGSDEANCGMCGTVCAADETCSGGQCSAPADPCTNNTCSTHGWCEAGVCICDPGYAGASCSSCDGIWQAVPDAQPLSCEPTVLIDGTNLDDVLAGAAANERVRGLDGNDSIQGLDGQDLVNGNVGIDTVNGNVGPDAVYGGQGDDNVAGGGNDDLVVGGDGNDQVVGGGGNDRMIGGLGNDTLEGVDGDDRYMIDGLGADTFIDTLGNDAARCIPGITITSDMLVNGDRHITLNTGGTIVIVDDAVESISGC